MIPPFNNQFPGRKRWRSHLHRIDGLAHSQTRCAPDRRRAKPAADLIHAPVEVYPFRGIFKKIELLSPANQMTKPHTYEPDQHSPLVKLAEKIPGRFEQCMVKLGVRNPQLLTLCVDVRILDLYSDT